MRNGIAETAPGNRAKVEIDSSVGIAAAWSRINGQISELEILSYNSMARAIEAAAARCDFRAPY